MLTCHAVLCCAALQVGDCAPDKGVDPHSANASHHAIDPALHARLRKFYAPTNAELYKLLGRDLGWG
jgi:hypothetical protein